MEMFQPLQLDGGGLGNGDVGATMTTLSSITAKRFRFEFTLRDNGV